jgi:hypothetical protein
VIRSGVRSSEQEKRLRTITMKALLNRMINILIRPRDEWLLIKDEPATYAKLLLTYVIPLAAIPPLAVIAGSFVFSENLPNNALAHLLITNLLWYCMYVLNVVVVGAVITAIVTASDARWTGLQGFKVAAYSFTPLFIAGFVAVLPKMGWMIYAAVLYSIYLIYLGIMAITGTSKKRSAGYAVVSFLAAAVLVGVMNLGEYFLESFVVNKFVL